jgi:hypothetical protein
MKNEFIIYLRLKTETAHLDFSELLKQQGIPGELLCCNNKPCCEEKFFRITITHAEGVRLKKILDTLETYEAFELYEYVSW